MDLSSQTKEVGVRQRLKTLMPWIFYALVAAFLFAYIQRTDFSQLDGLQIAVPYMALATVVTLGFRFWGAYIWFVLLNSLGATDLKRHARQLLYVYAKAWLGRYIPGTVPWILGKIYFASQHGISKNKLAISSLLEGALQVVVALAVAFLLLILDPRLDVIGTGMKWLMAGALTACIVALVPAVFNRIVSLAYRLIRKKILGSEHLANSKTIGKGALLYAVGALVNGLAFFLIAKAVYADLSVNDLFFVIGASSLAGAAGMLAIFVPSGIGVREGVQVLLFSTIMPLEIAVIIAVVLRVWSIIADFIFFGISKTITIIK